MSRLFQPNHMIMRKVIFTLCAAFLMAAGTASAQSVDTDRFMDTFIENFNSDRSEFFNCHGTYNYRYYPNVPSLSEKGSDVMVMRIDPSTPAGAGRGPEIGTKKLTHFGTYKARIRVPDVKKVQPNIGTVVGYFTYRMDKAFGLSEIDFEWLIADPTLIYVGTWTGKADQRVGRTINLAKGEILYTIYRSSHDGNRNHNITGIGNQPEKITAIPDYDASKRFYTYGFDWHPDRLTWWIIHPETNEKIILWDYQPESTALNGVEGFDGIPKSPTTYLLNYWHTDNWPVDTNPKSIEAPAYPYALEVDWMSYEPFVEESQNWIETNNWQ